MTKAFPCLKLTFPSLSEYEPQSICEHLQYLFALLQNSNRKYIDPTGLVKALGLDTGQQQVNPCDPRGRSSEPSFRNTELLSQSL